MAQAIPGGHGENGIATALAARCGSRSRAPVMQGTAPNLDEVARVVRRHLPCGEYRAMLFGSRARETPSPHSDWDIGIVGPAELPGHVLQRIHADLDDLPTLHRFDVVDLGTVSDTFRERALRESPPL